MATRLIAPSGPTVSVDDAKVDGLLARGFSRVEEPKKATRRKSSESSDESDK